MVPCDCIAWRGRTSRARIAWRRRTSGESSTSRRLATATGSSSCRSSQPTRRRLVRRRMFFVAAIACEANTLRIRFATVTHSVMLIVCSLCSLSLKTVSAPKKTCNEYTNPVLCNYCFCSRAGVRSALCQCSKTEALLGTPCVIQLRLTIVLDECRSVSQVFPLTSVRFRGAWLKAQLALQIYLGPGGSSEASQDSLLPQDGRMAVDSPSKVKLKVAQAEARFLISWTDGNRPVRSVLGNWTRG